MGRSLQSKSEEKEEISKAILMLGRKASKQPKISYFLADKAQDSERNHKFVSYGLKK